MLDSPILLLIFNRPDNTSLVFDVIRQAKPRQLFIAADGPREGNENDSIRCAESRKVIEQVDWECEVKTLFREKNLGCKMAVSTGITWFFEHVEAGIILEDDCKPDQSFFSFCGQMLSHYRLDTRIMMICGTNYLPDEITGKIEHTYFFSNYYPIWGWASWRRAWQLYDVEMKGWENLKSSNQLQYIFPNIEISRYYESMFELIRNGFDTWDIQWWFSCIFQNGLSIVPRTNLISNNGVEGTHSNTQGSFYIDRPTVPVNPDEVIHPEFVVPDKWLNEMTYKYSHAQLELNKPAINFSEYTPDEVLSKFSLKVLLRYLIKRFQLKFKVI